MKKYLRGLSYLLMGLVLGSFIPMQSLMADGNISLWVNGKEIACNPAPVIIENRVFVPVSFVSYALGADATWDSADRKVLIKDRVVNNTIESNVDTIQQNANLNNNQINIAKTELEEYKQIGTDTVNITIEALNLMAQQNNPSDSEIIDMRNRVKEIKDKLNGWGIVSDNYKEAKTISIDMMTNLDSALYTRGFIQLGGTIAIKASSQLGEYIDRINEDMIKLNAEAIKIKKLNS